ncbi:hypothetical protein V1Y59_18420 [Gordonia sp. PKS22-38]|uniref:Lipoprotein n=1 Tax=Gordonia prachuapensis TaxID=3115651 RepID=A0ABU7MYQ9_9ACTN|nr:hypothetical protein [Gordonia sp. PKS22-38]
MRHQTVRRWPGRNAMSIALGAGAAALLLSACGSDTPAPLPDSSDVVSGDAPLTAEQAQTVRTSGRELMQSVVDSVAPAGFTPKSTASYEEWSKCEAKSSGLNSGGNFNGVNYIADIWFEPADEVPIDEVHNLLDSLPITWGEDQPDRGTSGVYWVHIQNTEPLRIIVGSPCYFLQDADDTGTIPNSAITEVTGFVSQDWGR